MKWLCVIVFVSFPQRTGHALNVPNGMSVLIDVMTKFIIYGMSNISTLKTSKQVNR